MKRTLAISLALLGASCSFLDSPDAAHIQSDRDFLEAIDPVLAPLVDGDPATTAPELSPATQENLKGLLDDRWFQLRKHEEAGSTGPGAQ